MGERIGSLFSGAGGLDLAVQAVFGGDVVWHAEIDKAACKVLAHRFPGVPNLGSVTDIDWAAVPAVDVLCGGFPCQDVSSAGKRAGIKAGTRSGLWSVFADAIESLRPRWVVIENVRGLLSATAHRTVGDDADGDVEPAAGVMGDGAGRPVLRAAGAVLGDLADLRYDAQWATMAAADIGAPHRRERVFILATAADREGGAGDGLQQQDLPQVCGGWDAEQQQPRVCSCGNPACVADAADSSRNGWDEGRPESARLVRGFDAALGGDGSGVALLPTPNADVGRGVRSPEGIAKRVAKGDKQFSLEDAVALLPTPTAVQGRNETSGRSNPDSCHHTSRSGGRIDEPLLGGQAREMASAWGKYEPAIRRWEALVGFAPAPTEPNKNGNPRLSAWFSEWLMGWPAGWVTDPAIGISRNDQLRIIGNGVCPQQAIAALQLLLPVSEVTA